MKDAVHPHENHRERLRGRFLRAGLDDFAPHNVLELLLFYPISRRDTNPTAHALIDRFGTVEATLTADREALLSVPGVGEGVARFFLALADVTERALAERSPAPRLGDADLLGRCFCRLTDVGETEMAAVLFLDNDFRVVGQRLFRGVSVHSSRFRVNEIAEEGLLRHAPMCAVAHLHPDGLALPKEEDLLLTRELRGALEVAGIRLVEHFLVGGGRYTTLLYRYSGTVPEGGELPSFATDVAEEEVAALTALLEASHIRADAAELLAAYGGLYPLLSASPARHRYAGLDDRLSALLALCFAAYAYSRRARPVPALGEEALLGYLSDCLRAEPDETVLLLLFDREGRHLATHTVGRGSVGEAAISSRRVAEGALFSGAARAVLAHNHPAGSATPSEADKAATDAIRRALGGLGITLVCHFIVAGDGISDFL